MNPAFAAASRATPNSGPDPLADLRSEGDVNLSPHRAAWQQDQLSEETRALLERDARCFLHQSLSTPCLNALEACQGSWIQDLEGRRYLDFHGNSVHQVGHGHPRVAAAIQDQIAQLSFCPRRYTNQMAVEFAEKLVSFAPGNLRRVLFAPGGAEAVGIAIKLARVATGRFKTVSMWESFHGASLDCISIGGEAVFRKGIGPLLPGCEHVPPPDPATCPFRCGASCNLACADYVEYVLQKEGDVAAVIAETVRCTPFIPPPEYWRKIRAACDRHGALLILDEIPIGLGRTGKFFAFEHYGIVPDIVVLGKGLGGGVFPLAAIIARDELNVAAQHALGHYTHEKNPVACAAGLATLQIIEQENLVARAAQLGESTLASLKSFASQHRMVGEARGLGLLLGLALIREPSQAADTADRVMYAALSRGLSFKVTMGNMLTLTPPLVITTAEMEQALCILDQALTEVEDSLGLPGVTAAT